MSVIIQVFHKNKGNSTAIDRIFREKMENSSHFYPLPFLFIKYGSCKGLNITITDKPTHGVGTEVTENA